MFAKGPDPWISATPTVNIPFWVAVAFLVILLIFTIARSRWHRIRSDVLARSPAAESLEGSGLLVTRLGEVRWRESFLTALRAASASLDKEGSEVSLATSDAIQDLATVKDQVAAL